MPAHLPKGVYTFPRSGPTDECGQPRFVPVWSVLYESLPFPLLHYFGEPGWSPGWYGENRKSRTLSTTTGKPVQIFQHCRQRLLCEPACQILSTRAQEHACDSCARQDDLVLSYCDKQLPKKRLTTLNAINDAAPEATVGKRLPVSIMGPRQTAKESNWMQWPQSHVWESHT